MEAINLSLMDNILGEPSYIVRIKFRKCQLGPSYIVRIKFPKCQLGPLLGSK